MTISKLYIIVEQQDQCFGHGDYRLIPQITLSLSESTSILAFKSREKALQYANDNRESFSRPAIVAIQLGVID